MSKNYLIACALLIATSAIANDSKFKSAILVNNNGDSIKGMIDYSSLKKNVQSISFTDEKNEQHNYEASDIKSLYVTEESERYISATVSVDLTPSDYNKAFQSMISSAMQEQKTIFLQELVSSNFIKLYSYNDGIRSHFYYVKNNEIPVELVYHYLYKDGSIITDNSYKNQLVNLVPDCASVNQKISSTHYLERELKNIVIGLISCENSTNKISVAQETKLPVKFGALAGVMYNSFNISGTSPSYPNNFSSIALDNYKSNVSPVIGVLMDLGLQKRSNSLHLVNELIYKNYKTSATGFTHTVLSDYDNKVDASFSYVQLNTIFRCHLLKTDGLNPFLNIGIGNAFVVATNKNSNEVSYENGTSETFVAFDDAQKYETCFLAGAGVTAGRIQIEARYSSGNGFSPYVKLKSKVTSFQLTCSFHF